MLHNCVHFQIGCLQDSGARCRLARPPGVTWAGCLRHLFVDWNWASLRETLLHRGGVWRDAAVRHESPAGVKVLNCIEDLDQGAMDRTIQRREDLDSIA